MNRPYLVGVIIASALALALNGQAKSWIPPNCKINVNYVNEARRLLGVYLGDPRGATYSRVRVKLKGVASTFQTFGGGRKSPDDVYEVEGWVPKEEPLRAVMWDGLEYPIVKVLGPASIEKARKASLNSGYDRFRPRQAMGDYSSLQNYQTVAAPALWLLLGEVDVAEHLFQKISPNGYPGLRAWIASRYRTRAFYALQTHDDEGALVWLEKEHQLDIPRQSDDLLRPYNIFQPLLPLIKDVEAKIKDRQPLLSIEQIQELPEERRAAELGRVLSNVRSIWGWGSAGMDPALKAIAESGPPLFLALLHNISMEDRFTRAEKPSRNFPGPSLASIGYAAQQAMNQMWFQQYYYRERSPEEQLAIYERQRKQQWPEPLVEVLEDARVSDLTANGALTHINTSYVVGISWVVRRNRLASAKFTARINRATEFRLDRLRTGLDLTSRSIDWNSLVNLTTYYGVWDFAEAKPHMLAVLELAKTVMSRDNSVNPQGWETALSLVEIGLRNGDINFANEFAWLCTRKDAPEHWMGLARVAVSGRGDQVVSGAIQGLLFNELRLQRQDQPARDGLILLSNLSGYGLSEIMSLQPVRAWFRAALNNPVYELVEGPRIYHIPSLERRFELPSEISGPKFMRLSVGDYCALFLVDRFETGLEFDLFAKEGVRTKQREALRQWILSLPDGPVKERHVGEPPKMRARPRGTAARDVLLLHRRGLVEFAEFAVH